MNKQREPGFYWVMYKGEWRVAQLYFWPSGDPEWSLTCNDDLFDDDDFDEIDERRIERIEK